MCEPLKSAFPENELKSIRVVLMDATVTTLEHVEEVELGTFGVMPGAVHWFTSDGQMRVFVFSHREGSETMIYRETNVVRLGK